MKKNSTLTHSVKFKYIMALKLASDKDIKWLYEKTLREYNKRQRKERTTEDL